MILKSFRILPKLPIFAAMLFTASFLYAQPSSPPAEPVPTADPQLPGDEGANLSPAEMKKKADNAIATMKASLSEVIAIHQAATKQKDVLQINCVSDRLIQIKKLLNIAEAARNELTEAIANENQRDSYHQLSKVTISGENIETLSGEARGCIGEGMIIVGPTPVQVSAPPIKDNPTKGDSTDLVDGQDDNGITIERPACISPVGSC